MDCRSWLAVASLAIAWSPVAAAAPVFIPMDSAADLEAEGFERNEGAGEITYGGGLMTVDAIGFEEWFQYEGTPSKWWDSVHPSKGWWLEARVRIDAADPSCSSGGPGLWIHDRGGLYRVWFGDGGIEAEPGGSAAVDTSEFHLYRIESFIDGTRRILVDGDEVITTSADMAGEGTLALVLGDLGGCGPSVSVWDHYAYDTFEPGQEDGDVDADGVTNADDNCFEVSNADQANVDGDGLGDACDPCPADVLDDSDGDGVCDSDDACPDDPTVTEEPCPSDSSGFQGDGFLDEGSESAGTTGSASTSTSAGLDGDGTGGKVSASASAGGTVGEAESSEGTGSAGQGEPGEGCSCRSGNRSQGGAWWAGIVLVALARRRAR